MSQCKTEWHARMTPKVDPGSPTGYALTAIGDLLAALTTQAETIRRLEGEVARLSARAESLNMLVADYEVSMAHEGMQKLRQRAEAAEGRVRELEAALKADVHTCNGPGFGRCPICNAHEARKKPATGEGEG